MVKKQQLIGNSILSLTRTREISHRRCGHWNGCRPLTEDPKATDTAVLCPDLCLPDNEGLRGEIKGGGRLPLQSHAPVLRSASTDNQPRFSLILYCFYSNINRPEHCIVVV